MALLLAFLWFVVLYVAWQRDRIWADIWNNTFPVRNHHSCHWVHSARFRPKCPLWNQLDRRIWQCQVCHCKLHARRLFNRFDNAKFISFYNKLYKLWKSFWGRLEVRYTSFLRISRVFMEHIKPSISLGSKLILFSVCSIRIRSRNRDICKTYWIYCADLTNL